MLAALIVLEELLEPNELFVLGTLLHVESQGQDSEPVLSYRFIVDLHVVVQGLLVTKVKVVLHVTVSDHTVRRLLLVLHFLYLSTFYGKDTSFGGTNNLLYGRCHTLY